MWEKVATGVLYVALLAACGGAWMYSLLIAMMSDGCMGDSTRCSAVLFAPAYLVMWGGIVWAAVQPLVRISAALRTKGRLIIWPIQGFGILAASLVTGTAILYLATN